MKAKKSLGQNFLKSSSAIAKIVAAGNIQKGDVVVEIGPGKGALTEKILAEIIARGAERVIAIEKDTLLTFFLREKFAKQITAGKLILIEEDILKLDIQKIIGAGKYKIIANIPYNITGAILKKFLAGIHQPTDMVLMVQHEVAKRILARDGKESILSISIKAYGEPQMIVKVPARYFSPSPKVDSAVIAIRNISRKVFLSGKKGRVENHEEKFWEIIHAGFAHKRKILSSNLKKVFFDKKDVLVNLKNKRAEELALSEWIDLTLI